MSCCGRSIPHASHPLPAGWHRTSTGSSRAPLRRQFAPVFEYVGVTALTVMGGASGKRYRFERRGARLTVDAADRPSLAAVPQLREVVG
jgi:hypothetical protein